MTLSVALLFWGTQFEPKQSQIAISCLTFLSWRLDCDGVCPVPCYPLDIFVTLIVKYIQILEC